jgi:hypothetical protein
MRIWVIILALLGAVPARALVLGGGDADKDCRIAFDGVEATAGASGVVCVDGDPACDADGVANGTCRFDVRVCVGVSVEGCMPVEIDRIVVGGEALSVPELPATADVCGDASTVDVTVDGPASATTLRGYRGNELGEVDYLNLCCVSAAGPLRAAACSVAFDSAASGCVGLPARAMRRVERAREKVARATGEPGAAPKLLRKARKQMRRLRALGRKIAGGSDCGFALGLMASHAEETLQAAASSPAAPAP